MSLEEFLVDFWGIAIGVVISLGVSAIVFQIILRKSTNIVVLAANTLLLLALITWLLSYALATRLEIHSLALSFSNRSTVGPDYTVAIYAVALAIGFAILLVFHRYPLVVFAFIFIVGLVDIRGNMFLLEGMIENVSISQEYVNAPPFQKIWLDYYLYGGHPQRIAYYLFMALISLYLYLMSKIGDIKVESLRIAFGEEGARRIRFLSNYPVRFAVGARLALVGAIIINFLFIWDQRLSREEQLNCYGKSYFLQSAFQRKRDAANCSRVFELYGMPVVEDSSMSE